MGGGAQLEMPRQFRVEEPANLLEPLVAMLRDPEADT